MASDCPAPAIVVVVPKQADLGTVDALARLHLAAQRLGWRILIRHPDDDLPRLIELAGLDRVLRLEARGQPEGGEQRIRIEEVVERSDAAT